MTTANQSTATAVPTPWSRMVAIPFLFVIGLDSLVGEVTSANIGERTLIHRGLIALSMSVVLILILIAAYVVNSDRKAARWARQPVNGNLPRDATLPLAVDENPVDMRTRKVMGFISAGYAGVWAVAAAVAALLPKFDGGMVPASIAASSILCAAMAIYFFRLRQGRATLTEGSLSIGDRTVPLTAETTCSFVKRPLFGLRSLCVEVRSGNESIRFLPLSYHHAAPAAAGKGSHWLRALAARCHGGDARAWLAHGLPSLTGTDAAQPLSAPKRMLIAGAFCLLVGLKLWLTLEKLGAVS